MTEDYRIEYLPVAQADLDDIFEYIRKDNRTAPAEFLELLDGAISKLARFPQMGPIPHDPRLQSLGYRILVIDNDLVFFVIQGQAVEIRRVVHGSRRYSFLL